MKQILGLCVVLAMAWSSSAFAGDSTPGHGDIRKLINEDLLAGDNFLSASQLENRLAAARVQKVIPSSRKLAELLGISERRAAAIIIGPEGGRNVIDYFATTDPGETAIICIGSKCACYGDEDCNKMFTTICADPSTNGSCIGQMCTCTP